MRVILLIAICLCSGGAFRTAAQPGGIVFLDPRNAANDTIDFDITLFGKPLFASFIVENTGTSTIYIPRKVVPFFSVERYTDITDVRYFEFTNEEPIPFQVTTTKLRDTFELRFISDPDTSRLDYALGFKIGRMVIGLTDSPSGTLPFKKTDTFTVIAWKTKHFLASKREEMRFDSVYVSAENVLAEWMLKNVSDGEITVSDRRITPLSPVIGISGFSVATPLESVTMPHDSHLPWTLRYRPAARGADSARLALVYSPNIDGRTDSTLLTLRGVGVQQEITLGNGTTGQPNPVVIRGDTIDLGGVNAGDSAAVMIVLENRGNLAFGGSAGALLENTEHFSLVRALNTTRRLQPGASDTAVVKFRPTRRGTFVTAFSISSDIRSRISTAPDVASKLTWHIRGRAVEPELQLGADARDTLDYGEILLPADNSCATAAPVRRITARNTGNEILTLSFGGIQPPFRIKGGAQRDIPPADSAVVEIECAPSGAGAFRSPLTLTTNEQTGKNFRAFTLTGSAAVQTVALSLPQIVSPAGRRVSAAIAAVSDVKRASAFSATLMYDTTLLDFVRFDRSRSSSRAATLTIDDPTPGALRFSLFDAGGGLLSGDTLIVAEFSTYFGEPAPTPLALHRPKMGETGCDSTAFFTIQNGSFSPDSSCGNAYRAMLGMKGVFRFAAVGENPVRDRLEFVFETALPVETTITLCNSTGGQVAELALGVFGEGIHYAGCSTERCASGLYFVEMRAGIFRKMYPVFIVR